jgi:hypothetical protein
MFFLSERLFGWVQWFSRRKLLPRDQHLSFVDCTVPELGKAKLHGLSQGQGQIKRLQVV